MAVAVDNLELLKGEKRREQEAAQTLDKLIEGCSGKKIVTGHTGHTWRPTWSGIGHKLSSSFVICRRWAKRGRGE